MGSVCSSSDPPMNPYAVDNTHFDYLKVVGKGAFGKVNAVVKRGTELDGNEQVLAIKRLTKSEVLKVDPTLHTVTTERSVMTQVHSKFCLNVIHIFQNEFEVCFVMPFMRGGDLRYYLTTIGRMDEKLAAYYAAELVLALEDLHSINYIYRDLKPENILFDEKGHVRISDFGICFFVTHPGHFAHSKTGTPGYLAPEILSKQPYSFPVDIYCLGIVLYEMLHLRRPDEPVIFENVSDSCKDLLLKLLNPDQSLRIKIPDIKAHSFFKDINWENLAAQNITAPYIPDVSKANCSNTFSLEDQMAEEKFESISSEQQKLFAAFDFNNIIVSSDKILK